MPGLSSSWPSLNSGGQTAPATQTARILNANADTKALLNHISNSTNHRVPAAIQAYLQTVKDLTSDLLQHPIAEPLTALRAEFNLLRSDTVAIRQELTALRMSSERQSIAHQLGPASYANALRGAPPPAHHLSSHGSSSSAGVSPPDLAREREVTVRLNDRALVERFRRDTSAQMTAKVDYHRERAAGRAPLLASVRILASEQLRSGDLRFTARTAREAEILRLHQEWVPAVGKKAEVLLPSWGIVVHDINVRSLGVNSPRNDELRSRQSTIMKELLSTNRHDWGEATILRLNWLTTPIGKSGSLIIEFTSPIPANVAIERGVLWDGRYLTAVAFDRTMRARQC